MAFIVTAITNIARAVHGKKGTKMADIKDFIPEWYSDGDPGELEYQSLEDMKKALFSIAKASNSSKTKNRKG